MVNDICTIQLSIGNSYKDQIVCNVLEMDACHVLLGHPWQYDLQRVDRGRDNTYEFSWMGNKIILLPLNHQTPCKKGKHIEKTGSLFTVVRRKEFIKEADHMVWGLIVKGTRESTNLACLPTEVQELLKEHSSLMKEPTELPPLPSVTFNIRLI